VDELKVGTFIKAKIGEDAKYRRVEVVEVEPSGDLNVKVRLKGESKKAPAKDVWMKLCDVRLIRQFSVDWDVFDAELPTDQDPASRDRRQAAFAAWGRGSKSLTLDQLQRGVREGVAKAFGADVEETENCVKSAWRAARNLAPPRKKNKKKAAKTVDIKEFHAFIVALKYYLELAQLFEHLDSNQEDDQRLSRRECRKGLGAGLEVWGITEEILAEKFQGLDPWTPAISFEDFAKLCVESRWSVMNLDMDLDSSDDEVLMASAGATLRSAAGIAHEDKRYGQECLQNRKKVTEVFAKADTNNSGMISEDELVAVFANLNPSITEEVAKKLFRLADSNHDGQVDYEEFCLWLFR